MPHVDRFSVSLDTELLAAFDRHLLAHGYENRSEAVRDMIRDLLVSSRLEQGDEPVVGILSAVCDYRMVGTAKRIRSRLLTEADVVLGSLHLALDEHREAWVITLKGPVDRIQGLANDIQALRGTSLGHLSMVPLRQ